MMAGPSLGWLTVLTPFNRILAGDQHGRREFGRVLSGYVGHVGS